MSKSKAQKQQKLSQSKIIDLIYLLYTKFKYFVHDTSVAFLIKVHRDLKNTIKDKNTQLQEKLTKFETEAMELVKTNIKEVREEKQKDVAELHAERKKEFIAKKIKPEDLTESNRAYLSCKDVVDRWNLEIDKFILEIKNDSKQELKDHCATLTAQTLQDIDEEKTNTQKFFDSSVQTLEDNSKDLFASILEQLSSNQITLQEAFQQEKIFEQDSLKLLGLQD